MKSSREKAKANRDETKAVLEEMKTAVETGLEEAKSTDLEETPEETEAVVERQKGPKEESAMDAIGALEDRYGTGISLYGAADGQRSGPRVMVGPGRNWPSHADG
jgi:hypothetical protein